MFLFTIKFKRNDKKWPSWAELADFEFTKTVEENNYEKAIEAFAETIAELVNSSEGMPAIEYLKSYKIRPYTNHDQREIENFKRIVAEKAIELLTKSILDKI